jgi:hypothetical protein
VGEGKCHRHRCLPERDRRQHPNRLHPVNQYPRPRGEEDVGHQIGQQEGRDGKPRAGQIVDPNSQSHRGKHITKRREPHGHDDQPEVSFVEQQVHAYGSLGRIVAVILVGSIVPDRTPGRFAGWASSPHPVLAGY